MGVEWVCFTENMSTERRSTEIKQDTKQEFKTERGTPPQLQGLAQSFYKGMMYDLLFDLAFLRRFHLFFPGLEYYLLHVAKVIVPYVNVLEIKFENYSTKTQVTAKA